MAQSSNGLEVPEKTNGGSIPGCDDEIGGGVPEQVGEKERVYPLKEVLEMIDGAAGIGEGRYLLIGVPNKGWESKGLCMLRAQGISRDFHTYYLVSELASLIESILDGGAARGGFAHLTQCEVDTVMLQTNALLDLIAGRQSNPLISSLNKRIEGEHKKILDTIMEGGTAHLAGTSRPGNRATEQSHREPQNRATESHNFGSYENLLINWGAAKGNEVGNDSMPLNNMSTSSGKYPPGFAPAGTSRPQNRATESHISRGGRLEQVGQMERVFPLKEVLEMIERKCQDYNQGAAGSSEGGTSYFHHVSSGKGWELKELRMLTPNGFETFSLAYDHAFLIKSILDRGAARGSEGGFAHLTQCEVDEVMLQTNALLDLIGYSRNFAGRQSNPLISSLSKGCEADEFEQAICKGCVPHMAGKQIKSTRGGEGITVNNNRDAESYIIDIKDEEPSQSTDFVIQKPNSASYATRMQAIGTRRRQNISLLHQIRATQSRRTIYINGGELQEAKIKMLQWSTPMTLAIFTIAATTTHSLTKHLLRFELVLIAMSFACLVFRVLFHEKLSSKSLNVAANLALACNVSAFFVLVSICFAQI